MDTNSLASLLTENSTEASPPSIPLRPTSSPNLPAMIKDAIRTNFNKRFSGHPMDFRLTRELVDFEKDLINDLTGIIVQNVVPIISR